MTYSGNGSNAAKNTTATFHKAGTYYFQVTIRDAQGLSVTSRVRAQLPQLTAADADVLDRELRAALTALADAAP